MVSKGGIMFATGLILLGSGAFSLVNSILRSDPIIMILGEAFDYDPAFTSG
ncbi:MAG: hypothetical protein ACREBU_05895 [Nitrososphaera sp.]